MKIKIALVTIYFVLICSCTKDGLRNVDYFSFGKAYGFCIGNCATFFQIRGDKIYPDDMERYNQTDMKFKPEPLGFEEYNAAHKLIEDFPSYLAKNPDKTFGCPDCVDQGGIYIEIKEDGQVKRWNFDTSISSLPAEIRDYVQEVSEVIDNLK